MRGELCIFRGSGAEVTPVVAPEVRPLDGVEFARQKLGFNPDARQAEVLASIPQRSAVIVID